MSVEGNVRRAVTIALEGWTYLDTYVKVGLILDSYEVVTLLLLACHNR